MAERTVTLTIDGLQVTCPVGCTVYEAARMAGIVIPTFCHHEKLVPVGACRMCLVEIEAMVTLQTACSTPVREGMVVRAFTSPAAVKARMANIEFLLTNHPLDCPICDKGGECPLQDQALRDGPGRSRYVEDKRHKLKHFPLGSFIVLDQERCVLCWRCIRFLDEWADDHELDRFGRGADTRLATYDHRPLTSKWQGNTIDVCPVGALTSQVFRFEARPWELANTASVCPLCAVGCNLVLGVKNNTLRRVTPRENMQVNDAWLCDRGRFGHGFVDHPGRLATPLVRRDGALQPATWDEVLALIARRFSDIVAAGGPHAVAGLASTRVTNEANYLFQRFFRAVVGTNNVDHLGRVPAGAVPLSSLPELEHRDLILLVGLDPSTEAPLVELWIKKAVLRHGARVLVVNPWQIELNRSAAAWLGYRPGTGLAAINGLARALLAGREPRPANLREQRGWLDPYRPEDVERVAGTPTGALRHAARLLGDAARPIVLYGPNWLLTAGSPLAVSAAVDPGQPAAAIAAVHNLALLLGDAEAAFVPWHNNSLGALDMGAVPDRYPGQLPVGDQRVRSRLASFWGARLPSQRGLDFDEMLAAGREGRLQALWIMGSDPVGDCPAAGEALSHIPFLIVQDLYLTDTAALADVVLPAAGLSEVEGTFTNMTGRVQAVHAARYLPGLGGGRGARPDWWIIVELARRVAEPRQQRAWSLSSPAEVLAEMTRCLPSFQALESVALDALGWQPAPAPRGGRRAFVPVDAPLPGGKAEGGLTLVPGRLFYDRGVLLSRAERIQSVVPAPWVLIHPADAQRLGLAGGDLVSLLSPAGQWPATLQVGEGIVPGTALAPLNVGEAPVTVLMQDCRTLPQVTIVARRQQEGARGEQAAS